jgi:tRNA(His) 5'-end guanylyltransferase
MDKSDIAKRMKSYEKRENSYQFLPYLPVCARIDGRSFSKFTKGLTKPFDKRMSDSMIETTKMLVAETGALIGYTQSDEISLIWYKPKRDSQIFFNGKYFKMVSNLASLSTIYFYKNILTKLPEKSELNPTFDCRVWQVPSCIEAVNYLIWRENDAIKNSVSMLARVYFSHKELLNVNKNQMIALLNDEKGVNWSDQPVFFRRGTFVKRVPRTIKTIEGQDIIRNKVEAIKIPKLTKILNREDFIFNNSKSLI